MSLRLTQWQECPLCGFPLDEEATRTGELEICLFGVTCFGACPNCHRVMEAAENTWSFRKRCWRWLWRNRPEIFARGVT